MPAPAAYDATRRAWHVAGHGDLAAAFRRARRHSRVVRALRVSIPLAVVAVIALGALGNRVVGWAGAELAAISNKIISGTKITMDRPRMAGYTRDGRAYEMNAQTAVQDLRSPNLVDLAQVRNRLQLLDGRTVNITADRGTYDSKNEVIVLRDNVLCVASDGTEIRLSEMTLDVRKGHVVSQKPVEVAQPSGHINANQLEVVDSGAVVHFRGGVRYRFSLTEEAKTADAAPPRPAP